MININAIYYASLNGSWLNMRHDSESGRMSGWQGHFESLRWSSLYCELCWMKEENTNDKLEEKSGAC